MEVQAGLLLTVSRQVVVALVILVALIVVTAAGTVIKARHPTSAGPSLPKWLLLVLIASCILLVAALVVIPAVL